MPQIYRYLTLVFSFLSDEHLPPHVHVTDGDGVSIFDLIIRDGVLIDIKVRRKKLVPPISIKHQGIAKTIITAYYADIVRKWVKYFVLRQNVEIEIIQKVENMTFDTQKLVDEMQSLHEHFYPMAKKKPKTSKSKKQ
ncbi:MAG: DUF4160 domain-containing protein [Tannerella sp.]|nr:DUF4160 domain-containing protein [Tannerella sp.]